MDLLQLQYFQKAAELEHISQAAKEFYIAQPAMSRTIAQLEKELGVPLFERRGRSIRLNAYGKVFLRQTNAAFSALADGRREILEMAKKGTYEIRLAFLAASPFLPELLSTFRARHPHIGFRLLQRVPTYAQDEFDLCVSCLPLSLPDVQSTPLLTEEIFLALPKSHTLAQRPDIALEEVREEGFIHLKPGNALREITDDFCRQAGFIPSVLFESDDPATVRGLIRAGQGIGFIPAVSWGDMADTRIALLRIKQPACKRTIGISWLPRRYQSQAVRLFYEYTIDFFARLQKKQDYPDE